MNEGETDFTTQPQYHVQPQYGKAIKHFDDVLLANALLELDLMIAEIQDGTLRPWDRLPRVRRILDSHANSRQWFLHYMGHAVAPGAVQQATMEAQP